MKNVDKNDKPIDDPTELESFSIDEMIKDIANEETAKIIDLDTSSDYQTMTVSQLKDILIEKNLPVSGNKTKLIQRILDNDK